MHHCKKKNMCPKLKNSYSWFSEEQLIKFGKHKLTGDQLHHWRRISETESSVLYASLNSWFVFIAELIIQVAFVKNFQPNSLIRIRFNYGKFSSWENWQLYTSSIIGKLSELYITSKTTGPEKTENFRIYYFSTIKWSNKFYKCNYNLKQILFCIFDGYFQGVLCFLQPKQGASLT